jgi:hypothetical protein
VRSPATHAAFTLSEIFWLVVWIFRSAAASGHGPDIFPSFSASRHLACTLRNVFLNLSSDVMSVFSHFAGSACAGNGEEEQPGGDRCHPTNVRHAQPPGSPIRR